MTTTNKLTSNNIAKRLETHIHSVLIKLKQQDLSREIFIYSASNKTKVLGASKLMPDKNGKLKKMTKPQRKKWASELCRNILLRRGDMLNYNLILLQNPERSMMIQIVL